MLGRMVSTMRTVYVLGEVKQLRRGDITQTAASRNEWIFSTTDDAIVNNGMRFFVAGWTK